MIGYAESYSKVRLEDALVCECADTHDKHSRLARLTGNVLCSDRREADEGQDGGEARQPHGPFQAAQDIENNKAAKPQLHVHVRLFRNTLCGWHPIPALCYARMAACMQSGSPVQQASTLEMHATHTKTAVQD
jgi:hypothetical protein